MHSVDVMAAIEGLDNNPTERAIVKFFACKKKLDSFTNEELNALPKAFLYHVASNAVKNFWHSVPREWARDPVLRELQPCTDHSHHQQVSIAKMPSIRQCRTCQLIKLYHGHANIRLRKDYVSSFHGCDEEEEEEAAAGADPAAEKESTSTLEKDISDFCWSWSH